MVYDLTINEDDWLEPLAIYPTPAFQSGDLNAKYVVMHNTNGRPYGKALRDWTENTDTKESMHLLINRGGDYFQLAPFTRRVWHCGASHYQGHHGLNNWAIGIALEDIPSEENYTEEQLAFLDKLMPVLVQTYNIRDIVLHSHVSDDISDPGYNFPISRYWPYVRYGNANSEGNYAVAIPTENLNVRGGPDVRFEIIDTLQAGSGVKVLRFDFDWALVAYERKGGTNKTGWVASCWLRRL